MAFSLHPKKIQEKFVEVWGDGLLELGLGLVVEQKFLLLLDYRFLEFRFVWREKFLTVVVLAVGRDIVVLLSEDPKNQGSGQLWTEGEDLLPQRSAFLEQEGVVDQDVGQEQGHAGEVLAL